MSWTMSTLRAFARLAGLASIVVSAGACQAAPPPPSAELPPTEVADPPSGDVIELPSEPAADADRCPSSPDERAAIRIDRQGLCFLAPAGFELLGQEHGSSVVTAPDSGEGGHRERLIIEMDPALGRNLDTVVDQVLADHRLPGMETLDYTVERDTRLGGEPAAVVHGLPGQSINRRVLAVVGDRRYSLMFFPDEPEAAEARAEMEALYRSVLETLVVFDPDPAMALPFLPADGGYPQTADLVWMQQDFSTGDCRMLVIDGETTYAGDCASASTTVDGAPFGWAELREHVQPFVALGGDVSVLVRGRGDAYDPAWQLAVQHWGRVSYDEVTSGNVSATGRTAMSWWMDEAPSEGDAAAASRCRHLIVLNHGYGYARLDPCPNAGAEPPAEDDAGEILAEGWLATPELQRFMELYSWRAPIASGASTLDGRGTEPATDEEIVELAALADHVHQVLVEGASSP